MIPEKPQIITSPICYNGDKRAIPESTPLGTNQLSFESGFPVLTSTPLNAGGLPPDRRDFNAALNMLSTFIYYMQSGNHFAWSNQLDYNAGAFVIGSDNAVYFCIKANGATEPNTVQNPLSASSYWLKIINSNGKINVNNLSVTLGALATKSTITSADITDGTITTNDIANNAITSAKIADGTIINTDIANTTITGAKLANNTITATQLANNAVTTDKIANGAVTVAKLAGSISATLPVGFIYFQLRNQSTPDVLFGTSGKWQDISSSYAGRFFRVAGGAAAAYGSQQAGGVPNILGNMTTSDLEAWTSSIYSGALSTVNQAGPTHKGGEAWYTTIAKNIYIDAKNANSLYGAASEVRPINETIRVWKKIA